MQQLQKLPQRGKIRQSSQQQGLQLNRLIKFIENKKSPSFNKLKNILTKNNHLFSDRQHRRISAQKDFNLHDQTVSVNTKNIFVAKNKTQGLSPRTTQEEQTKKYKVFISKKELDFLYDGKKSQNLPSSIKQKINSSVNKEQNKRSNLFPPLAMPKFKRPIIFEKYQDEASRWLNSGILILDNKSQNQSNQPEKKEQNQSKKLAMQNLKIQRQLYNKSLQKLIEKALKNKTKQFSSNSNHIPIIQGIEGYDSKLVVSGEQYERDHQSLYAQKGRLLTNPNIKIKKYTKNKSMKKNIIQNHITFRNPESESKQKEQLDFSNMENKKRIIHTNREAYYLQSSLKLKTQVTTSPVEYNASTIKRDSRTSRLIKELESSILKNQQIINEKPYKNKNFADLMSQLQNDLSESIQKKQKKLTKKKRIKTKAKTIHTQLVNQKTLNKWQIAGYDYVQSPEDLQQNQEIQKYVENLAKKSTKIAFYKNTLSIQSQNLLK